MALLRAVRPKAWRRSISFRGWEGAGWPMGPAVSTVRRSQVGCQIVFLLGLPSTVWQPVVRGAIRLMLCRSTVDVPTLYSCKIPLILCTQVFSVVLVLSIVPRVHRRVQ